MTAVSKFIVHGCIPYQSGLPSFALPVFKTLVSRDCCFAQDVDELNLKIKSFRKLEDIGNELVFINNGVIAFCGNPLVYCYIDSSKNVYCDSLKNIREKLLSESLALQDRPSISLQIAELVGSIQQKKEARKNVRNLIDARSGASSGNYFYNVSALHSTLWDLLLNSLGSDDARERALAVRSQIGVEIIGQEIKIYIDCLSPEDRASLDTAKIIEDLRREFDLSDDELAERVDVIVDLEDIIQDNKKLYNTIRGIGRQEERVAILLRAIMENPSAVSIVSKEYRKDRGQFASWVIETLRNLAEKHNNSLKLNIQAVINSLYGEVFRMNRGYLLLMLAKHLGCYDDASGAIRDIINNATDSETQWYGNLIERQLDESRASLDSIQPDLFDN